jgi:hypothetical protein
MRAAAVTFSHFGGVALNSYDLDICSFRVLDMKPGVQVILRGGASFFQLARYDFPIEPLDANRAALKRTARSIVIKLSFACDSGMIASSEKSAPLLRFSNSSKSPMTPVVISAMLAVLCWPNIREE